MTKVTTAQVVDTQPGAPVDPIDLLVPPPRGPRRAVLTVLGVVVLVTVAAVLWNTGLVRPRIGLVSASASWVQAGPGSDPGVTFVLRNDGSVPFHLEGVDARAPGLGRPRVAVSLLQADGTPARSDGGSPVVGGGLQIRVVLTFRSWDCDRIENYGSATLPVHARGPLGLNATTSLDPGFHFDPPGVDSIDGPSDPNEIGWAAALTWTACHPGSPAPHGFIS
jgi:hypothetical protein